MDKATQIPKWNSFVIVVTVLHAGIYKCLETLYKYTEEGSFYVFIVDQTIDGLDATELRNQYRNLTVIRTPKSDFHHTGNLGHSQGTNLALKLVETPYVTLLNDDVEFIHKDWWQGILDTFEKVEKADPKRPAILVNAASIKLPDWSLGRVAGDDHYILPYKEEYTDEDWEFLKNEPHYCNEHLTIQPGSVIDGINLYCSVVDMKKLLEVGFLEETLYTGSGNDYDYSCRAYAYGYRCISTTLSWVFHHWSVSFHSKEEIEKLVQPELVCGDLRVKWGDRLDVWGPKCTQCDERLLLIKGTNTATCSKHLDEKYELPETGTVPL